MENSSISIETKNLASGNFQVKFFIEGKLEKQYGYLLVSEPKSVGEIIDQIKIKLERRKVEKEHIDPLFPLNPESEDKNFYLFSA